ANSASYVGMRLLLLRRHSRQIPGVHMTVDRTGDEIKTVAVDDIDIGFGTSRGGCCCTGDRHDPIVVDVYGGILHRTRPFGRDEGNVFDTDILSDGRSAEKAQRCQAQDRGHPQTSREFSSINW